MDRRLLRSSLTAAAVAVTASTALLSPIAPAGAAPRFAVSSVPAGVASGGELALDQGRNRLFIADNNDSLRTRGSDFIPSPDPVRPKVEVFDTTTNRPVRSIDLANQPGGMMMIGGAELIPVKQVPDGLAIDSRRGRVLVTNAHASGITVFGMDDKRVGPGNLTSLPKSHPMGAVADPATGRFYVGLNGADKVAVFSSAGRHIGDIGNLYKASFLDVDAGRNRLYVGNADYEAKKNNFVAVVDLRTGRVIKKIPTPSNSRPKVDPTTGRVWAASFDTGKISIIDPASLRVVRTIDTKTSPSKIAFDAGRRLAYTANLQKKTITVLNADSGAIVATLPTGAAVHTVVVDQKTGIVYGSQHISGKLTVVRPS
ncbi:YncE family protein [Gordonia sp. X0973]|uniref:YncE family protein n=1 Tax=Gordonia sp. X0973 TaxID=2742602 RepID=UPI000F5374B3|nr:YncE family protein [Gordonia sp. X0973]QKT06678.1 YncE family protein [Gordonia sp. X0973]